MLRWFYFKYFLCALHNGLIRKGYISHLYALWLDKSQCLLIKKESCMKKLWPEIFMHENFLFMHVNINFSCIKMKMSCMKMKLFNPSMFYSPQAFPWVVGQYTTSCMEFSSTKIFW